MDSSSYVKRIARRGLLLALAMILSYVEAVLPLVPALPGLKLGLPNMIIMMLLYLDTAASAILINIMRVILVGFLFGNMSSVLYGLSGAICSFLCMYILVKSKHFTPYGVSAAGGIIHNMAQLVVAGLVLRSIYIGFYIPYLLVGGVLTGLLNAFLLQRIRSLELIRSLFKK